MVAEREATASLARRSSFHEDLHTVSATWAEPAADGSECLAPVFWAISD